MKDTITVREWIKNFNEGKYDDTNFNTQVDAGWYDWFCSTDSLAKRLKKMGKIIKDIKNDYILDNYYVWFKNNCPCTFSLYDDFRFEPLNEEERDRKYFLVQCDHPHGDEMMYNIATARNDYKTEFKCKNKSQVLKVIEKLGKDFENDKDCSNEITEEEIQEMEQLIRKKIERMTTIYKNK